MLTPADIDSQKFGTTRLKEGYDQQEVDAFLDRVADEYQAARDEIARLQQENASLRRRNENLTNQPTTVIPPMAPSPPPSPSAERILILAQETADKALDDAKTEADRIVREAGGKAARAVEEAQEVREKLEREARERAEAIINEGYVEKAQRLADVEAQHAQVQSAVQQLQERGARIRDWLRHSLDESEGKL
jgi:DivIVA domain-containing protein